MSVPTARVSLDPERVVGEVSPLLFGGFAEHLGRCIYGGLYDPASRHADQNGLRRDVLDALRELNFSVIRYPGGNFLSGYRWQDGVGPRAQRPVRRDLAWRSIETNHFGTNEFIAFCRAVGAAPMLGVNLGTGTPEEAAQLVEYCNAPAGSAWADLRVRHGFSDPHCVTYWCLGNEMDGPWQIGQLTAEDYGRKAREAAKIMRWHDPTIRLVACGSSSNTLNTFPAWDREVLEQCYDHVDYLSLHYYAANRDNDTASYLATTADLESFIATLAAVLRYVQAKLRSRRTVRLSWDEWNVWYKNQQMDGGWTQAPALLEEVYNLEDALVVAQWLSLFLRHCDVLHVACLAQVVNVIAPLMTRGDQLLKQTIFYPFMLFRRHATGRALAPLVAAPCAPTARYGDQPLLDVSATWDAEHGRAAVFLVNRSLNAHLLTAVRWQGDHVVRAETAIQLSGTDPKAANTFDTPHTVVPRAISCPPLSDGQWQLDLPPLSFTVLAGPVVNA